jgi:nucleotide-binding universal stress UspA family protein
MFERILVPVDGSERATRAIPVAARIARATDAKVILANVFDLTAAFGTYLGPVPISQTMIDEQHDALRAYLNTLSASSELAGVSVDAEVLTGPAGFSLLKAIETDKIDLVVMNSHGRSGMARWMVGSVAEQIVHFATVPVLLLRETLDSDQARVTALTAPWQAVVGLDGSALAEEALTPTALVLQALSGTTGGRIHLVRAIRPVTDADELAPVLGSPRQVQSAHDLVTRDARAALDDEAQRLSTRYSALEVTTAVVDTRDPAAALIDTAGQLAGGSAQGAPVNVLIGMATHGRGGLARWTLGSVTYRVIESSRVPLLVVRPGEIAQAQRAVRAQLTGVRG